ncbi:MAG: hypothetical protein HY820_42915 [Acidobacteria bacterium]|nr:hypothetical protein [Acidobacteriota bacterium]
MNPRKMKGAGAFMLVFGFCILIGGYRSINLAVGISKDRPAGASEVKAYQSSQSPQRM